MQFLNNLIRILFLILAFTVDVVAEEEKKKDEPKQEKGEAPEGGENKAESKEGEEKKEGDDDGKEKKKELSYLEKLQRRYIPRLPYLMIPSMGIPILKNGTSVGNLSILVELKGKDVESFRKLQADAVLLKDEIFCDLYYAMSRLWLGPDEPKISVLEARIKKRINQYYKSDLVEKARFHVFSMTLYRKF